MLYRYYTSATFGWERFWSNPISACRTRRALTLKNLNENVKWLIWESAQISIEDSKIYRSARCILYILAAIEKKYIIIHIIFWGEDKDVEYTCRTWRTSLSELIFLSGDANYILNIFNNKGFLIRERNLRIYLTHASCAWITNTIISCCATVAI